MLRLEIEDFAGTRLLDPRSILTVFHAGWCPFCRGFLTLFEDTMKDMTDPVAAIVDISDTNGPLWETFEVDIVPTLVGFKNGEAVVRKDGVAGVGLDISELQDAVQKMKGASCT